MWEPGKSASPLAQIFGCFAFFGICIAMLIRSGGHPTIVVIAGFGVVVSLCALLGSIWGRMHLGNVIGVFIALALLVLATIAACSGVLTDAR